jgi:hypothetical protein
MELSLIPALQIERELYNLPRGFERFWSYIATVTGGTDDMVLPIGSMNPMGHDHNAQLLDALLALEAEAIAQQALDEAARRLEGVAGSLKACLVVVDDARGQWTNRYFNEMSRLNSVGEVKRHFATVSLWTSQVWDADSIRRETLACVYRQAYLQAKGAPKTLRQILAQEGQTLYFAGEQGPVLEAEDLAYSRMVMEPHLESTDFPTLFACLYGDEAARNAGYDPLGLSARAGYAVALADAQEAGRPPEALLKEQP